VTIVPCPEINAVNAECINTRNTRLLRPEAPRHVDVVANRATATVEDDGLQTDVVVWKQVESFTTSMLHSCNYGIFFSW
jgi:hypothetical protein